MTSSNLARADALRGRDVPIADTGITARPRSSVSAAPIERRRHRLALIAIVSVLSGISVAGANYYLADLPARVRHPLHPWLRPSGFVGQTAGVVALVIFVFLWLYPLRKRIKRLAFTGSVGRWLDVHVTAALSLPLLLGIHAGWRFEGIIGLGYGAILLVCASGVAGRYLYTRIPRTRSGVELTREEVAAQRSALIDRIAQTTTVSRSVIERALAVEAPNLERAGLLSVIRHMSANDLARWRLARTLRARLTSLAPKTGHLSRPTIEEAVRLASREIALAQQIRMLDATHRVFRFWHVAHRPVALTALITVLIHVAVVVALGATWFL
jgi:hypothetical protein